MLAIVLSNRDNSTKSPGCRGKGHSSAGAVPLLAAQPSRESHLSQLGPAETWDLWPSAEGSQANRAPVAGVGTEKCRRPQDCIGRLSTGETKLRVRRRDPGEAENWLVEGVPREVSLEMTEKGSDRGGNHVVHDTQEHPGHLRSLLQPMHLIPFLQR